MKKQLISAVLLSALSALSAWAQSPVQVDSPWVRGTVAQQKATGAFMKITPQQNLRLVAARSPVAAVVEIHEMKMDKDVMRMSAMPQGLALPAGQATELKPGSYHVMLMDLLQPVRAGETVPLTLVFEGADKQRFEQQVEAPVKALNPGMAPMKHEMDHGGHKH